MFASRRSRLGVVNVAALARDVAVSLCCTYRLYEASEAAEGREAGQGNARRRHPLTDPGVSLGRAQRWVSSRLWAGWCKTAQLSFGLDAGQTPAGRLGDTVASFVCGSYVQGAGVAGQIRGYRGVFSA